MSPFFSNLDKFPDFPDWYNHDSDIDEVQI